MDIGKHNNGGEHETEGAISLTHGSEDKPSFQTKKGGLKVLTPFRTQVHKKTPYFPQRKRPPHRSEGAQINTKCAYVTSSHRDTILKRRKHYLTNTIFCKVATALWRHTHRTQLGEKQFQVNLTQALSRKTPCGMGAYFAKELRSCSARSPV